MKRSMISSIIEKLNKILDKIKTRKLMYYFYSLKTSELDSIVAVDIQDVLEITSSLTLDVINVLLGANILSSRYQIICPKCGFDIKTFEKYTEYNEFHELNKGKMTCDVCYSEYKLNINKNTVVYFTINKKFYEELDDFFSDEQDESEPPNSNIDIFLNEFQNEKDINKRTNEIESIIKEKTKDEFISLYKSKAVRRNDILFNLNDDDYKKLKELYSLTFDNLDNESAGKESNKAENLLKGNRLEDLFNELLNTTRLFVSTRNIRTKEPANQFDGTVRNEYVNASISTCLLGQYFLVESKNEETKIEPGYIDRVASNIKGRGGLVKTGIIIGRENPPRNFLQRTRETLLVNDNNVRIIYFSKNDINKIIFEKINLLDMIESKIVALLANVDEKKISVEFFGYK